MTNAEIKSPIFRKAVEAVDAGDIALLEEFVISHPELTTQRLDYPNGGYFKDPYLLWFVADNPIRTGKLPANIVAITRLLIQHVKQNDLNNVQKQLDYCVELVTTGRTPRECGVQIEMIDLLLNEGAKLNGIIGALNQGNIDAAKHLISRGAQLTLTGAVCFDQIDDVIQLVAESNPREKLTALTAAAFYGKAEMVAYLLSIGVNPNGYPLAGSGFHHHATPLHQAVSSGSLQSVELLVEAGADLNAEDKVYNGTPFHWAEYLQREDGHDGPVKENYKLIADFLSNK